MFHACLVATFLFFVYTLRYFYTFSGTDLLTRCHSELPLFCCFWFQKSQKMNILGIGQDKSQSQYFTMGNTEPEDETEEYLEGATHPGRAAWPAPGGAAASGTPSASLFAYKKPPIPKP